MKSWRLFVATKFRRLAAGIFKAWGNLSNPMEKGRTAVEAALPLIVFDEFPPG
jgi:hypothetical protein